MSSKSPATETLSATEARQQFSQLLNRAFRGDVRILVEKGGIPVAAIVSARDLERLQHDDADDEDDDRVFQEFGDLFKDVPLDELEREVANAIQFARASRARDE